MRFKSICVILMLIGLNLYSIRDWNTYTNNTHIYEVIKINNTMNLATWGGFVAYDVSDRSIQSKLTINDGLDDHDIKCFSLLENDIFLLGTRNSGVIGIKNEQIVLQIKENIGLPSSNVNKIVNKNNLIYIATDAGLSVFSETEDFPLPLWMNNFTVNNGLTNDDIRNILITNNDLLVLSSFEGIDYCHIDSLQYVDSWKHIGDETLPSTQISSIDMSDKYIVFATSEGLIVFDIYLDEYRIYDESNILEDNSVFPVHIDNEQNIWFSYGYWDEIELEITENNDLAINTFNVENFPDADDIVIQSWTDDNSNISNKVMSILTDDESIYFSTWGDGFYLSDKDFSNIDWEQYEPNCISAHTITDLDVDQNNILWVSSGHLGSGTTSRGTKGVSSFDGDEWVNYNVKNSGLRSDNIICLSIDGLNRKWFGPWATSNSDLENYGWQAGVSIFDDANNEWSSYTTANGLMNNTISCLGYDSHNQMWVGSYPGGVNVIQNDSVFVQSFPLYNYADPDFGPDPLEFGFSRNNIYFGCYDSGINILSQYDYPVNMDLIWNEIWSLSPMSDLRSSRIEAITVLEENDRDEVWIASANGLYVHYDYLDDPNDEWFKMDIDIKRKKWTGSWSNETLYYVDEPRLFGSNAGTPTALYADPFKRIWIGSRDNGISVYDTVSETYKNFNMDNSPLLSNYISCFSYDPLSGNLYIGTPKGLNSVIIGSSQNKSEELSDILVYPNPFITEKHSKITFKNQVESGTFPAGQNTCRIYDLAGDVIIELTENRFLEFEWDGKSISGKNCGSGVYFFVIGTEDGRVEKGKFALIRGN